MKHRSLFTACVCSASLTALAQGAQPATNFGNNGLAVFNYINQPYDLIMSDTDPMPDGGLLLCGTHMTGSESRMFAQRFGANGQAMLSFGSSSKFISPATFGPLGCAQAAVRPEGSVMLVGSRSHAGAYYLDVIQLTPQGNVDTQFGENGISVVQLSSSIAVSDIVLDASGTAYISGSIGSFACVLRMLPDGSLDQDFGENGLTLITSPLGNGLTGRSIAYSPSGYVVVAGSCNDPQPTSSFVTALDLQGQPVPWFGIDGFQELDLFTNGLEILTRVILLPNGSLVLSGNRYGTSALLADVYVMLGADGSRATGFGQEGVVTWALQSGTTHYNFQPHLLPDGDLLFAGSQISSSGLLCKLFLHRLNADGTTETDFGTDGTYYYQPSGGSFDDSYSGSALTDGRIAIAAPRYGPSGPAHAVQVFQLSELTTATSESAALQAGVSAYPNPTTGPITLSNWTASDRNIHLLDAMGRTVQQWNTASLGANADMKLYLAPTLANGRYFLAGSGVERSHHLPVELVR